MPVGYGPHVETAGWDNKITWERRKEVISPHRAFLGSNLKDVSAVCIMYSEKRLTPYSIVSYNKQVK